MVKEFWLHVQNEYLVGDTFENSMLLKSEKRLKNVYELKKMQSK